MRDIHILLRVTLQGSLRKEGGGGKFNNNWFMVIKFWMHVGGC